MKKGWWIKQPNHNGNYVQLSEDSGVKPTFQNPFEVAHRMNILDIVKVLNE